MTANQAVQPVFATILSGATAYFELGSSSSLIHSMQISWFESVSNATLTLETSNADATKAPASVVNVSYWKPETSVTLVGPAASGAGCELVHLGNMGSRRCRLKVVAAANTTLELTPHGKE